MKEIQWSATNDQTVWENPDEGVIRFASEEDAQKMMRLLAFARPEVDAIRNAALEEAALECEDLEGRGKDDHGDSWMGNAMHAIRKLKRELPQNSLQEKP